MTIKKIDAANCEKEDLIAMLEDAVNKLEEKKFKLRTTQVKLSAMKVRINRMKAIVTYQREKIIQLYKVNSGPAMIRWGREWPNVSQKLVSNDISM